MIEAVDALQPAGRVALAGPAQHAQTLPQGGAESRGEAGQGGPVQPDRREAPDIEAGENEENRRHHGGGQQAGPEALPEQGGAGEEQPARQQRRQCRRLVNVGGTRSEEHTSELKSLMRNSYAVFCLTKKTK